MKFLIQWLLVLLTVLNPILSSAALTDFDRQELAFENLLAPYNSGFESGKAKWTASGGTLAAVTSGSNLLAGKGSATWDASASGQTLTSQAITIPKGYYGLDCEVEILAQVPSGTATHYVRAYDGTNVQAYQAIISSTTPRWNPVTFPCPQSGTIALQIYANADEPLIAIDVGYVGRSKRVGSTQLISEWKSYTPTGTWTTNTTYTGKWRQIGDTAEIQVRLDLTGAPTAATLSVNLPSNMVIDTAKLASGTNQAVLPNSWGSMRDDASYSGPLAAFYSSTTAVSLRTPSAANPIYYSGIDATTPITWTTSDSLTITFKVPIVGWTAQTTASIDAISKRGSAYFSTGSSATTTSGSAVAFNDAAFASPTLEGQALAPTTANDIGIRMTGAPAGVYEVNLVGWLYAYRASGETGTNCAYDLYDGTTSRSSTVAGAPNVAGVSTLDGISTLSGTFTLASAGTINVVLRGQRTSGTGACYAGGPVSISIKNVSQNSPAMVLPLSVSSALSNGGRLVTAVVQAVNGSTCTVSEEDGASGAYDWLGSTTPIAAGRCTVAINAGVFSAKPKCFIEAYATTYTGATQSLASHFSALSSTSMTLELRYDTGGSNTISGDDSPMMVMCFGAR